MESNTILVDYTKWFSLVVINHIRFCYRSLFRYWRSSYPIRYRRCSIHQQCWICHFDWIAITTPQYYLSVACGSTGENGEFISWVLSILIHLLCFFYFLLYFFMNNLFQTVRLSMDYLSLESTVYTTCQYDYLEVGD